MAQTKTVQDAIIEKKIGFEFFPGVFLDGYSWMRFDMKQMKENRCDTPWVSLPQLTGWLLNPDSVSNKKDTNNEVYGVESK